MILCVKRLSTYDYILAERAIASEAKATATARGENSSEIEVMTSVCRLCRLPEEYAPERRGETDGKGKGKGEDGFETGTGTETDGFIRSRRCFLAVAIAHAIARVRGRARIAAAVESRGGVR